MNIIATDNTASTTLSLTIPVTDTNEPTALTAPENIQTVETQE